MTIGLFLLLITYGKNTANSLHGGATAALVDVLGSAVIYTVGAPTTGVSVEISVSYVDAAYAGVCTYLSLFPISYLLWLWFLLPK